MAGTIKELDDYKKQELVKGGDSDKAINEKLDWCKSTSKEKYDKIKKRVEQHNEFFDGDQIKYSIPKYRSDTIFNYIFPGVVNMVGLLTDANFGPQVHPRPAEDEEEYNKNKEKAKGLEIALRALWDSKYVPEKMTKALYKYVIDEDVILVPKWSYGDDDVDVEVSSIVNWRFDPGADNAEDSSWAIRETEKSWNFFAKNFPDKLDEIKEAINKKGKESIDSGKFKIEEYFTDEIYIMRIADVVLEKKPNPYYEFRAEENQREEHDEKGFSEERIPFKKVDNYFKQPKKPIIHLSAYGTGDLYSRSRMQQILKPQVDLNKRMQQIDDNIILGSSGIWLYDTLLVSEDDMDKVTFKPFQKIGVPGGHNSLMRESGAGLPSGIMDNVLQIQRGLDDIFGYHEVSRGSKVRTSTFGEAALLKEADQTSIRLLARNYQTALTKLMKYWAQLISLFYTVDHHIQWNDEMGAERFLTLTREDISPEMHIDVKVGAQLNRDKAEQREEVSMLAQAGRIDPLTLFETLDYPNPQRLANRLSNWNKFGIISDEKMPAGGESGAPGAMPGATNAQVLRQQAALADEENQRMAAGESVPTNPDDVVEIHLEIHKAFPKQSNLLAAHIAEHEESGGGQGSQMAGPTPGPGQMM